MQTRIIDHSEAEAFDQFVANSAYGDMLQTYSWGEIKKPDWEPLRAVVEDDQQQICAVMSILFRRIPIINRTIAYVPRGPVFADTADAQLINYTLESLTTLARERSAILIKIDPAIPEGELSTQVLQENSFHLTGTDHDFGGTQPRYTFRLSLTGGEEIFARFQKMRYINQVRPEKRSDFRSNEKQVLLIFIQPFPKPANVMIL